MITTINHQPAIIPTVVCNFGWFYGSSLRLPEYTYKIGTNNYPPGKTGLGSNVTLPSATVASTFGDLASLQKNFPATGTIVLDNGIIHASVFYTSLITISGTALSGVQGFGGCTGGTGSYTTSITNIYDPRDYVDSMPLKQSITFDATDSANLGLPVTMTPPGITILTYQWSFGNGLTGNGPQATVFYGYGATPGSIRTTLTVTDSLGRQDSCAHSLNLLNLSPSWAKVVRV